MPRSIQEILDHADELAKRFEDYEPGPDDERPVEEYRRQRRNSGTAPLPSRPEPDNPTIVGRRTCGSSPST